MDSFLRILTPFFGAPKNYQEMLWKTTVADLWLALICTFLLRYDPWIDGFFKRLEELPGVREFAAIAKLPQITSIDLPTVSVVNVVIALAVMFFSRITRFHDLISIFSESAPGGGHCFDSCSHNLRVTDWLAGNPYISRTRAVCATLTSSDGASATIEPLESLKMQA